MHGAFVITCSDCMHLYLCALCIGLANIVNQQKHPILYGWIARMHEVDAVKATVLPAKAHLAFMKSAMETGGTKHDYSTVDTSGKGIKIYASKPSQ